MSKKFIITEEEKKHILSLYGILLKEALDPVKGGEQTFSVNFKAGWYDPQNEEAYLEGQAKLTSELDKFVKEQLIPYLQKNPSSIVGMKFRSGESNIPNTDREGKDKGKDQPLDPGRLSFLRKYYLESYLNNILIPQIRAVDKEADIPNLEYEKIEAKEPWIGKPWCPKESLKPDDKVGRSCLAKWKEQNYTDRDIYNKDQISEFSISVKPKKGTTTTEDDDCLVGLEIQIYVDKHNCQNAEFFVFANDTLLTNVAGGVTANMNNSDTKRGIPKAQGGLQFSPMLLNPGYGYLKNGDGKKGNYSYNTVNKEGDLKGQRSDTFIITNEQAKQILKDGASKYGDKMNIFMYPTTDPSHSDICFAKITKGDKVIFDEQLLEIKGKVLILDKCGNKVVDEQGDQNAVPLVGSNLNNLIAQRTAMQTELKKDGNWAQILSNSKSDTKALIQEEVFNLTNKIISLAAYLSDNFCSNKQSYDEVRGRLQQDLNIFNNLLNGKTETGAEPEGVRTKINFKKNIKGIKSDEISYTDKGFAFNPMYGDIKYYVDIFYEVFALLFFDKENDSLGVLDEQTLRKRLGILQIKQKLRTKLGLNNFNCSSSKT